jgi:hypothetical protein
MWKFVGAAVATVVLCTSLMAQNEPFLGIWKARTADPNQPGQMIINEPAAGGFTSIRVNIGADNKSSAEIHPVAFDEKPYATLGGDARQISYKRIDANTLQRTQDRNGKINVDTEQVSADGKTLTIRAADGSNPRVFDKQFSVEPVAH